jgi:hypothetical protein
MTVSAAFWKLGEALPLNFLIESALKMSQLTTSQNLRRVEVKSRIRVRTESALFLRKTFGFSLFMTFGIIFCQGFHVWGFHLSDAFLHWLGAATVGQVSALLAMVLRQK